jgi:hypothetical protein
LLVKLGN